MFPKDTITIEYYRSSGPGGQRKNKKDTAVRITHLATGLSATAAESRYRSINLKRALERLSERVERSQRPATPRVHTRIPRGVDERRLKSKRNVSAIKQMRRPVNDSE
jgi:protein subunit release factor B